MRGLRSPQRKQLFQDLEAGQANGSRETSPYSMGSPLTSLGDLSDADPPEVATLGYSPYSKIRNVSISSRAPHQLCTDAPLLAPCRPYHSPSARHFRARRSRPPRRRLLPEPRRRARTGEDRAFYPHHSFQLRLVLRPSSRSRHPRARISRRPHARR